MRFELTHPEFLWGLLLFIAVAWIYRYSLADLSCGRRRLLLVVRSMILALLILTLGGLSFRTVSSEKMVVFLVDMSRSVGPDAGRYSNDFIAQADPLLNETPYQVVEFAATPRLASKDDTNVAEFSIDETNIASVLKPAVALVPPSRTAHLVLFSDGNETTGNALQAAMRAGVKISTVPLPTSPEPEVQLAEIRTPERIRQGEPFFLDVVVRSTVRTEGTIRVFRDDYKIVEESKIFEPGENIFRFSQEPGEERQQAFTATVICRDDMLLENNDATTVVQVDGPPRVLMIESDPDTVFDFVAAMREQEIEIDARPPSGFPSTLDEMNRFDAIVLSDVPATLFSVEQMELLRNYVRDLGGGFLMLGGEHAFGLGGYSESTISDLLPVRSNFEKEQEKPSLAICLAIDRSGSMQGEKLELAKDAAKGVVELLSAQDFVSIIAFDAVAHSIVPSQNVLSPSTIRSRIARISAEGGTSIYPAMLQAFEELEKTPAKIKHIVLLTDGQSDPGDFETLARQMVGAKITLTAVGVGDADHDLLGRLAEIGQGRYYRCDDPRSIPQIFAKETMTVSKSGLHEIPFLPITATRSEIMDGLSIQSAPPLLGFVKTEPKVSSRSLLVTETGEPLLSISRYGLGISVAFTSDVKSRWASEWLDWPEFPVFWSRILRYAMRKTDSNRSNIRLERSGDKARLTMEVLDADGNFYNKATGRLNVFGPNGINTNVPLDQIAPGRYESRFYTPERGGYQIRPIIHGENGLSLDIPSRGLSVGCPEELYLKPVNTPLLKKIAEATGGLYDPSPRAFAEKVAQTDTSDATWKIRPLWPWLLALVVCLFVFDVFLRRTVFV